MKQTQKITTSNKFPSVLLRLTVIITLVTTTTNIISVV